MKTLYLYQGVTFYPHVSYIGQHTRNFPVGHTVPLRQITHGSAHFTVWTSVRHEPIIQLFYQMQIKVQSGIFTVENNLINDTAECNSLFGICHSVVF